DKGSPLSSSHSCAAGVWHTSHCVPWMKPSMKIQDATSFLILDVFRRVPWTAGGHLQGGPGYLPPASVSPAARVALPVARGMFAPTTCHLPCAGMDWTGARCWSPQPSSLSCPAYGMGLEGVASPQRGGFMPRRGGARNKAEKGWRGPGPVLWSLWGEGRQLASPKERGAYSPEGVGWGDNCDFLLPHPHILPL
ncbi:hypothetical protein Cadr_000025287, partial [Camelus dromedarius]